jgi:serine/threonine protein kinase
VVDVGTVDGGDPYIVMEHLEGDDLSAVLKREGAFSVERTVDYVLQACLALAEAHVAGIIHRDLKPSNLFLTRRPDGTPLIKVMDFGIAKTRGRMDQRVTDPSAIMGSPQYMAPEQLRAARDVDARADVWSLGVVLFELVTRRRPFDAETLGEIAAKVTADPPLPLPPSLPAGFADVIVRCLEKTPSRRFASVGALATALAPFGSTAAAGLAASVNGVLTSAANAKPRTDPLAQIMSAPTRPRLTALFARDAAARRRAWRILILSLLALAAVSISLAWILTRHPFASRSPSPSSTPSTTAPPDASPIHVSPLAPDAAVDAPSAVDAGTAAPRPRRPGSSRPDSARPRPRNDGSELDEDGDGIPDLR